jgi:pyridoxamine 5'-phosphate oxidase
MGPFTAAPSLATAGRGATWETGVASSPAEMRIHYEAAGLLEEAADPDPLLQFERWFEEARGAGLLEPNAMALATADARGRPSLRMVLLKGFGPQGFVFYTNQESRKAGELAANPRAALLFWWDRLHRQVRLEGRVEEGDPEAADAYFATRPYGSRIGAWASPQSRVVPSRAELEASERHYRQLYPEEASVPRPPHWVGYRLVPALVEFWQGRPSRLHDRLQYTRAEDGWTRERLAP